MIKSGEENPGAATDDCDSRHQQTTAIRATDTLRRANPPWPLVRHAQPWLRPQAPQAARLGQPVLLSTLFRLNEI